MHATVLAAADYDYRTVVIDDSICDSYPTIVSSRNSIKPMRLGRCQLCAGTQGNLRQTQITRCGGPPARSVRTITAHPRWLGSKEITYEPRDPKGRPAPTNRLEIAQAVRRTVEGAARKGTKTKRFQARFGKVAAHKNALIALPFEHRNASPGKLDTPLRHRQTKVHRQRQSGRPFTQPKVRVQARVILWLAAYMKAARHFAEAIWRPPQIS